MCEGALAAGNGQAGRDVEVGRMTTLVIMLLLLAGPTVGNALIGRATGRSSLDAPTAGCLGIALVFCFAGIGHFVRTEAMAEMMPPWMPGRVAIVYATGVLEFVVAIAVLVPRARLAAGADTLIGRPLEEVEKYYIQRALEVTNGKREEAANLLGIGERTLYRKIKEYDLRS